MSSALVERISTCCKHGAEVTVVFGDDPTPTDLRAFIREMLLACPTCKLDAESSIEDAGT